MSAYARRNAANLAKLTEWMTLHVIDRFVRSARTKSTVAITNVVFLLQMNQQCKVCGEPAAGFHFGAFTCEGCKVSPPANLMYPVFPKLHLSVGIYPGCRDKLPIEFSSNFASSSPLDRSR